MIAHWDEVDGHRRHAGHLQGTWQDLGRAAGTQTVGVKRVRLPPGGWSTPAHIHGRDEEILYVLAGSGLSWQGGKTYEIGPGDAAVHLANGEPHTLYGGADGIDVLAFGMRERDEAAYLPRAGVLWLGAHYVDAADPEHTPWKREAAAGPPELPAPSERPPSIANVADVEAFTLGEPPPGFAARWRNVGRAIGSVETGIKHIAVEPGNLNCPHHAHGAEEEIFVVLDGEGALELVGEHEESHALRAGHVVSRPAGTRVAHAFRAGKTALTLLAYGTRDPNDIAYYPRSNKVYFRGVGLMARVEALDYWDGE